MKRIWEHETKIMIYTSILTIFIVVIAFVWSESFTEDWGREVPIAWSVNVEGDNYIIEIIDVQPIPLDEVSWSILNLHRLCGYWQDPSNEEVRPEGDLSGIVFNQSDHDEARVKANGKFYSRDPAGDPPMNRNHTLFIVFMDNYNEGKLGSGDTIWLRSTDNDGATDEDFRFRLANDREAYGELTMPAV